MYDSLYGELLTYFPSPPHLMKEKRMIFIKVLHSWPITWMNLWFDSVRDAPYLFLNWIVLPIYELFTFSSIYAAESFVERSQDAWIYVYWLFGRYFLYLQCSVLVTTSWRTSMHRCISNIETSMHVSVYKNVVKTVQIF